jgi:hypothetical protein
MSIAWSDTYGNLVVYRAFADLSGTPIICKNDVAFPAIYPNVNNQKIRVMPQLFGTIELPA